MAGFLLFFAKESTIHVAVQILICRQKTLQVTVIDGCTKTLELAMKFESTTLFPGFCSRWNKVPGASYRFILNDKGRKGLKDTCTGAARLELTSLCLQGTALCCFPEIFGSRTIC